MRSVTRNTQTAYYQLYEGKQPILDAKGNMTGRHSEIYSEKTAFRANIYHGVEYSAYGSGSTPMPYGIQDEYSLSIYMSKDLGFDTNTILWVGETDRANYRVVAVHKNMVGILIKASELK